MITARWIIMAARVLRRPNSALGEIGNSDRYLIPSVAIFASSVCLSVYTFYTNTVAPKIESARFEQNVTFAGHIYQIATATDVPPMRVWIVVTHATESVWAVASLLLIFTVIFYVGRRLGGTSDFKKIFCMISYCMIPMIMGISIMYLGTGAYEAFFPDARSSHWLEAAPSDPLDFAIHYVMHSNIVAFSTLVWSAVLAVNAVRIADGFSIKRSLGIIVVSGAAKYLFDLWYGIVTGRIFFS